MSDDLTAPQLRDEYNRLVVRAQELGLSTTRPVKRFASLAVGRKRLTLLKMLIASNEATDPQVVAPLSEAEASNDAAEATTEAVSEDDMAKRKKSKGNGSKRGRKSKGNGSTIKEKT